MKILKPGYKTSEFIALVLLNVGVVATAIQGALTPKWAAVAAAISVGCYNIGRGLAKAGPTAPGK